MKDHISKCTGVQVIRRGTIISSCWEWILQYVEVRYTLYKKGGNIVSMTPYTLIQIQGQNQSGWNGDWLNYLYSFTPFFLAITLTYHDVQKFNQLTWEFLGKSSDNSGNVSENIWDIEKEKDPQERSGDLKWLLRLDTAETPAEANIQSVRIHLVKKN